jgi:hypothetical protein
MITMEQFITKKIHKDELVDIIFSITDQLMFLKANDMPLGKVILNIGYMYLNVENMGVQLVFLPIDKPMEKCNIEKFVRDLVSRLNYADKQASDCGYEFIRYFDRNETLYLSDFYKFILDVKNNRVADQDDGASPSDGADGPVAETVVTPVSSQQAASSFKLAKEVKDYSGTDIGFGTDDDSDDTSTTVLTNNSKVRPGPVIVRTRTGERIKVDKPIFCIGKSTQGVDYQVTDNNSVSRRHAYIINVNGVYYLRDNKSTNHTYLGGKIINSGTDMMLIDGSKFKLANEEFTFRER